MRCEPDCDLLQLVWVLLEEVLLDGTSRDTQGAQTVKNWFVEAAHFGHIWVDVERIGVTAEPVDECLVLGSGLFANEVSRALRDGAGHRAHICAFAAEATDTADEQRRCAYNSDLVGVLLDNVGLGHKHRTLAFVSDINNLLFHNVALVLLQWLEALNVLLTVQ